MFTNQLELVIFTTLLLRSDQKNLIISKYRNNLERQYHILWRAFWLPSSQAWSRLHLASKTLVKTNAGNLPKRYLEIETHVVMSPDFSGDDALRQP